VNRALTKWLQAPSILLLLIWIYPDRSGFNGWSNYEFFVTDPAFWPAITNTLVLVGSVLAITVIFGIILAVLLDRPFFGRGIARVMLISPFFIMPTVNALVWKNMMMNPIYGLSAVLFKAFGQEPIDWLSAFPLGSVIVIVSWQWIPFAFLIFMTSLQSQDQEQKEAALLDGASALSIFWHFTLPHLARPIAIVILIQTIFHLSIFAEIFVTTAGGPGNQSTNLAFLIFAQALQGFDVGVASAGMDLRLSDVLSHFLDGIDQLQNRAAGYCDTTEVVFQTDF